MLKPEITRQDCDAIIRNYLKTENVATMDFTLAPLFNHNYKLQINTYHQRQRTTVNFCVKSLVFSESKNILDHLEEIPKFRGDITPKLYYSTPNLSVFEDLRSQNFVFLPSLFNLDHLFMALTKLAQLHAASLIFEEDQRKLSKKFRLDKKYALLHINFSLKDVTNLISSVVENTDLSRVLEDLERKQFCSKFRKTLCHGNLQSKNLMFKIENGAPTDCRLTNLKSNFYVPPAYDVLQLIFFNSSENLRQHYYHDLLQHYYEALSAELKRYGVDGPKIISYETFQVSAHHCLPLIKIEVAQQIKTEQALQEMKISLLNSLLSKEDCNAIIQKKIGSGNYTFGSYKVVSLSDVSGFLGDYHKLQIKLNYQSQEETINCFIKCSPKSGIPREIAADLETFTREIFMYEVLIPQMKKYGVNIIDECLPRSYFYRPEEFIVFDDLALLGYRNLNALEPLDFPTMIMLTKKLAKFHCCSLLLEEKISEELGKPYRLIDAYKEYFNEPLFFEDEKHLGAKSFMTGIKSVLAAIDLFPELCNEATRENFKKSWPKLKELFYTVTKTSDRFRNVLNHGDLWTSNMMAKLENGIPIDCVLIDFQIVRYCPPGYDLLSVLHLTTDRATRLKHEEELIEIYYEEMKRVLNDFGYSVETVYPYEEYVGCLKYMKPQMVLQASVDCVLTMCTPEEISLFLANEEQCRYVYFEDRIEFLTAMCGKSALYKKRIQECILDIYDYSNSMCLEK